MGTFCSIQSHTKKKRRSTFSFQLTNLNSLPSPLPVFGVMGEPPHVHVGLYDLRAEDEVFLILASGDGLDPAVETKRLGAELQSWRGEKIKKDVMLVINNRVHGTQNIKTYLLLCDLSSMCSHFNKSKLTFTQEIIVIHKVLALKHADS